MKQVLRFNKVIKRIVFTGDLILLNGTFLSLYTLLGSKFFADPFIHSLPQVLVLLNLCYLVSNMSSGIILHRRVVRPEQIVWRALRNSAGHALFFSCALTFGNFGILSARFFLLFYIAFTLLLVCYRLLFRKILKSYRKHGGNSRSIILVGSNSNIIELYHQMTDDVTSGFRVIGYFDDQPGSRFPEKVNYLGKPGKIVDRLKQGGVEQVYCCLPSARSEEILPIIDYCENHLIRFFQCPQRAQLSEAAHVLRAPGQRARTLHPPGAAQFCRKPIQEACVRHRFLALVSLHPLPHYLCHCRADHQNHLAGSHLLQAKAQWRRRTGILVLQVPLHEGEHAERHPAGHLARSPQNALRQLPA